MKLRFVLCAFFLLGCQTLDLIANRLPQTADATPGNLATPIATSLPLDSLVFPNKGVYRHLDKITVEYDKFRDQTTVTLDPDIRTYGLEIRAFFISPGNTVQTPKGVSLTFVSFYKDFQYQNANDVIFLLDGRDRLRFDIERDSRVQSGYVLEFLTSYLGLYDFLRIVNAKTVEVQLFITTFSLTPMQQEALRDFASRMKP